ncbi:glycosyltransferase, partial [Patescibacteria group bacterium]|nr:glycosyltransferase [Patescibacteria group bacterium]
FRNSAFRFLSKPIISYLRIWDKIAGQRPDCYLAISKEVQGRIKKYYSRESRVIYPPADLMDWALSSSVHLRNRRLNAELSEAKRYFLIVSRLVAYKRVDTVIRVFNKLGMSLKIVGQGAEEGRLKKMAGGNIEFLPYLTEEELSLYYKNAQALIFPGVEDFGLVMVEAQSHGTPVIALRAGGAREIILEGKTGEFFDREDQSLINVLENFDKRRYNSKDCLKSAERFSFERFKKEFMGFFEKTAKDYNFKPR